MSLNFGQSLFPPRGEFSINYDYFDVSNGTGYDIYYGFNNAGTLGISTINTLSSGMIHKNGSDISLTLAGTYYELLDVNFDIIFNLPKRIKGNFLANIPFGVELHNGTTANVIYKCELLVYHYNGSSETQLGSTGTSELIFTSMSRDAEQSHITSIKVNLPTIRHFKKGETLRFTIKVYVKSTTTGEIMMGGIGCDPQNRTDTKIELEANDNQELQIIETNEPTQLSFHVPFVPDI